MQLEQTLPRILKESRAVKVLERSLEQNRLSHGILLHGKNLEYLEKITRIIASTLLKTQHDPYEHPDCHILRPQGKARAIKIGSESERSNGEWPQNSMRRLVIDMQKSSYQGERKVGIIFEADRMNTQSANAFLKTLEEPPDGTTLFLLTTRPYDLLDTIRSRCLNFRIPAEADPLAQTDWSKWLVDYQDWLELLLNKTNRENVPHIILKSYGLNERFRKILANITDEALKTQKEALSENLTTEEKDAIESGLGRGYRKQLLAEIEEATIRFARKIETNSPGRLPPAAIHRAIRSLEHSAGLMELNFNQNAALELFFLKSMRIWTSIHPSITAT